MTRDGVDIWREAILEKIKGEDYSGARSLLLDTLKVYPLLTKAPEILTICEVLCPTELAFSMDDADWYWVLQVLPIDTTSLIESRYCSIVNLLKPVEDDIPGASLALRYADRAFSVLSDPAKRAAFDSMRLTQPKNVNRIRWNFSMSGGDNSFVLNDQIQTSSVLNKDDQKISSCRQELPTESIYRRQHAWRRDADESSGYAGSELVEENHVAKKQKMLSGEEDAEGVACPPSAESRLHNFNRNSKIDSFAAGQIWSAYDWEKMPRRYALINAVVPKKMQLSVTWLTPDPRSLHGKQWLNAGLPIVCGRFLVKEDEQCLSGVALFSELLCTELQNHHVDIHPRKGDVWAIYRDWNADWCSEPSKRPNSRFHVVEVLTDYTEGSGVDVTCLSKVEGCENSFRKCSKTDSFCINNPFVLSHKIPSARKHGSEGSVEVLELDPSTVPQNLSDEHQDTNLSLGQNIRVSHDDFSRDQVWAVYDDRADAMPRSYVRVNDVISGDKISATFLEPHPVLDQEIQWVEEGLPVSCGIFRPCPTSSELELSRFSHPIKCEKSARKSFYRIFPQKGEVWMLYKDWNLSWKQPDIDSCQRQLVEITSDYSDKNGIHASSLVEAKGCLTIFHRQMHDGFELGKWVSRKEMLSFSHQAPAFLIVGNKEDQTKQIPQGSFYVEPSGLLPRLSWGKANNFYSQNFS